MVDAEVNTAPYKMHIWQIVSSSNFFFKTIHKYRVSAFLVNSLRGGSGKMAAAQRFPATQVPRVQDQVQEQF
jgi:hypothetical protein